MHFDYHGKSSTSQTIFAPHLHQEVGEVLQIHGRSRTYQSQFQSIQLQIQNAVNFEQVVCSSPWRSCFTCNGKTCHQDDPFSETPREIRKNNGMAKRIQKASVFSEAETSEDLQVNAL